MKNAAQFLAYPGFFGSVKELMQKGGNFKRAAETVWAAWGRAKSVDASSHEEVFKGMPLTNHGENRVEHCVKYDLSGYARLVTAYSNGICIFLFTGIHDAVDVWLDRNKGLDFIGRDQNGQLRIEPVFLSDTKPGKHGLIRTETDWMSSGPVIDLLPERYRNKILNSLDENSINDIRTIESQSDEDEVLNVVARIDDTKLSDVVLDVLLALRASDLIKAKNRVDLYANLVTHVADLSVVEVAKIVSSESTVRIQDVDPVLFEHFLRTADFREWMLYLHPAQRDIVGRDFNGPARLAGVSGSGKTSVVIHRALRLARLASNQRVLILTLNGALAKLIDDLIDAECGAIRPKNITIKSVFELCYDKLLQLEPNKNNYYQKSTITRNPYAISEHIDEIWEEFYHCGANAHDADEMFEVVRTLLVRNLSPQEYLRQEFDYLRSAFAPNERENYFEMDRSGRVIGLETRYRKMVLKGLIGWEKKMNAVGAIDDVGIVTALYHHIDKLKAEFDHVLVDEVQDLGTLELRIIRRLTKPGQNDLFLSGDAAQAVHTKHSDMKAAEIELPSARWIRLNQNYRNSRQILTAAHTMLTRSFEAIPSGTIDLDILSPEYANFTSPNPLLLRGDSVQQELAMAWAYATDHRDVSGNKKACIAFCGYSQNAIECLGSGLNLPVLSGATDISSDYLFLSDLEQTKGFEFDLMVVINCSQNVIPHPELPDNESFRELCKLYVALTRAKTELIVSYSGEASRFVKVVHECFNSSSRDAHGVQAKVLKDVVWPDPAIKRLGSMDSWQVTGKAFLRKREALGLSPPVQDTIISRVTGFKKTMRTAGGSLKQTEWKDFVGFYKDMNNPRNRSGVISDVTWGELTGRIEFLLGNHRLRSRQKPEILFPNETSFSNSVAVRAPITTEVQPQSPGNSGVEKANEAIPIYLYQGIFRWLPAKMSAHTIASLLVVQGVSNIENVAVGKAMNRGAIEFLLPQAVLTIWIQKRWLREIRHSQEFLALTKAGLDECLNRLAPVTPGPNQASSKYKVTAHNVNKLRKMILFGSEGVNQYKNFSQKVFVLNA